MTYLITFICILISLALFAGAFYLAKYVISLQHNANVWQDEFKRATDHIKTQEEVIAEMSNQISMMEREMQLNGQRPERSRAWNPRDPLNTEART